MQTARQLTPQARAHSEFIQVSIGTQEDAAAERRRANAAYLAMVASRPLKPPPYQFGDRPSSAARRALRRDIALGVYSPRVAYTGSEAAK